MLPHDPQARRQFVTSGCLRKVQEIQAEPGTELREYINTINNCFPEEIVRWAAGRIGSRRGAATHRASDHHVMRHPCFFRHCIQMPRVYASV